jgi:NarL family two-component system response regulator LiaR
LSKLRVLLADDHPLIVAGVRSALEAERDFEIAGEATSGAQVLPLIAHASPDVVLIDMRLPELDGLTCLARIRQKYPKVKVVLFSAVDDPSQIRRALEAGACAYIVKCIDPSDLAAVIRQAVAGSVFCLGSLEAEEVTRNGNDAGLSEREIEILVGVARGLSNRAIAKELWVSDQTVKFHLHNIYRKLDVKNRTEAAKYAYQNGLVKDAA